VNYWLLFCKLIDSNCSQSCLVAACVLAHWYSNQQVAVNWHTYVHTYIDICMYVYLLFGMSAAALSITAVYPDHETTSS